MIIIIGLGNPGKKYEYTRHNIGFRVVDEFRKRNNLSGFKPSKKFNSLISEDAFDSKKVIIAKPQTFMNESGKAVKTLINFYKTTRTVLLVIHDDVDLPLGKIRIAKNRGSAGHKGVQSVIDRLKTKNFIRFRFGIKPQAGKLKNSEKFVLQKFSKEEKNIVKEIIEKTVEAIELTLNQDLEKTMNKYNS